MEMLLIDFLCIGVLMFRYLFRNCKHSDISFKDEIRHFKKYQSLFSLANPFTTIFVYFRLFPYLKM